MEKANFLGSVEPTLAAKLVDRGKPCLSEPLRVVAIIVIVRILDPSISAIQAAMRSRMMH